MKYFDDASGTWKTVERLDDGSFVVNAQEQETVPTETVTTAKIEQDPNYEGVPRDATNTRFARELDTQAKIAMRKEQDKNGYQRAVEEGLMMATTVSPEGATKIRDAAKRSTKQGIIEASRVLSKKANELASASPDLARQYQDYSVKLREFGDQIQTKMQDAWYGANLRYGAPVGSGREGNNLGAKYPNGIGFIRPELEGKSYQQAMDDTLYTRFGKQTLGNRIDERKRYLRDNGEVASVFSPWVPIASQWKSMKEEGLNLGDLSLEGVGNLAGSAGMQGLGYLLPAAGGPIGLVGTAALQTLADLYQTPERPDSEEFYGDLAKDATASAAGGMLPGIGAAAVKKLNRARKTAKAMNGRQGEYDPVTEERIRQNKDALMELDRKIAENSRVASGNPEAMQNAFVMAAGADVPPELAWTRLPGYLTDEAGTRLTKESPWVDYVRNEMAAASKEGGTIKGSLTKAKRKKSELEQSLSQKRETTPTDEKVRIEQDYVKNLGKLNDRQIEKELTALEKTMSKKKGDLGKLSEPRFTEEDLATIKTLEQTLADSQESLKLIDKNSAPVGYDKVQNRINRTQGRLERIRSAANDRLQKQRTALQNELDKATARHEELWKTYGNDPESKGFQTAKRQVRTSSLSTKHAKQRHATNVDDVKLKLQETNEKIDELQQKLKENESRIATLNDPKTQENYRRGAEAIMKKKTETDTEKLRKSVGDIESSNRLLEAKRANAAQGRGEDSRPYENPFVSIVKAIPGGQFSAITSDLGLDMVQPEHKDTGSDKPTTLGNPFVNALRTLANRFTGAQNSPERYTNQYRGFKK